MKSAEFEAPAPLLAARTIDAEQVSAYLRAHPDFLAQNPELYAVLSPPVRVHGTIFADHMAAMLAQARARAANSERQTGDVLAAGRTAGGIAERVQEAVLALLQTTDAAECVAETWPGLLGIDAACLCCEAIRPRWRTLPSGAVAALLRQRAMVFRDRPLDAPLLHAEAALLAERDALIQVEAPFPALLALVSRDALALPNSAAWVFLGRAVSARLRA
jgi:uncharacterized protein YigA (DUF484 family)